MIEVAVLFAAVIICAGVLATWTLRRDIRAIRAIAKGEDAAVNEDIDERIAKIEARYGGPSFSEMLVGAQRHER